jgi:hypothetical protein
MLASSIALLALSISRLPVAEQEATLQGIEGGHTLRKAVPCSLGALACQGSATGTARPPRKQRCPNGARS